MLSTSLGLYTRILLTTYAPLSTPPIARLACYVPVGIWKGAALKILSHQRRRWLSVLIPGWKIVSRTCHTETVACGMLSRTKQKERLKAYTAVG